jgi:Amt family ammonium transporter
VGLFASVEISGKEDLAGLLTSGEISLIRTQLLGIITVGLMMMILSAGFWYLLKITLGLRVSLEEEAVGLDIGEHGMEAYHGFVEMETETWYESEIRINQ